MEAYFQVPQKLYTYTHGYAFKMVIKRTCFTTDKKEQEAKERLGVTWRYLVNKGIYYVEKVQFIEEELARNYHHGMKSKKNAQIINMLREKYPEIFNELTTIENSIKQGNTLQQQDQEVQP